MMHRRGNPRIMANSAEAMVDLRSDYTAAKASRFTRRRSNLGGTADAHYANTLHYYDLIEAVRDMERNEFAVGRLLDLAVQHEQLSGPTLDPDTGDPILNADIKAAHQEWANDPKNCCSQHQFTFNRQTRLISRSYKRDGDALASLLDDGRIQLFEADRVRTPTYKRGNRDRIVHGVEIDEHRRHVRYYVTKDPGFRRQIRLDQVAQLPAYDDLGDRITLLIADQQRISQTRGVTVFSRIFDRTGMGDDLEFANLVKHQIASAFGVFITQTDDAGRPLPNTTDIQLGSRETVTREDGTTETVEQLGVGTIVRLQPGEDVKDYRSNVPGDNFFPHIRLILQEIGATLGLPLVMVLMDASETNFSGYRGAIQQARQHAMDNRANVIEAQWLRPVHRWRMRRRIAEDPAFRAASRRPGIRIFNHVWRWPGWRYIQPLDDAKADGVRREGLLAPLSRIYADQGYDLDADLPVLLDDNAAAISGAIERAKKINEEHGTDVHWRDVLFLSSPKLNLAGEVTPGADADAANRGRANA